MKTIDEYLSELNTSYISESYSLGLKKEEILKVIKESFEPFFDNKNKIDKIKLQNLTLLFEDLLIVKSNSFYTEMFKLCLDTLHNARKKDEISCLNSVVYWRKQIVKSYSPLISIHNTEINVSELNIEDLVLNFFNEIGTFLEAIIQPYLRFFLHQVYICQDIKKTCEDLEKYSFGNVVDHLNRLSTFRDLLLISPWKITLNQWRNIAYHHDYIIKNNTIFCTYGVEPNRRSISLVIEELYYLRMLLSKVNMIFHLAFEIFLADNIKNLELSPKEVRKECYFVDYFQELLIEGLKVEKFNCSKEITSITLSDLMETKISLRITNIITFLESISQVIESKFLKVKYKKLSRRCGFVITFNSSQYNEILKITKSDKKMFEKIVREKTLEEDKSSPKISFDYQGNCFLDITFYNVDMKRKKVVNSKA